MIELALLGIASGIGFVGYHSKWFDKFAKELLRRSEELQNG